MFLQQNVSTPFVLSDFQYFRFMCSSFSFFFLSHNVTPLPPTTLSEIAVFHQSSSWRAFLICFPFSSENLAGREEHTHTLHPFKAVSPGSGSLPTSGTCMWKTESLATLWVSCTSFREFLSWKIDRVLFRAREPELKEKKQFYYRSTWDILAIFVWCSLESFVDVHQTELPVKNRSSLFIRMEF